MPRRGSRLSERLAAGWADADGPDLQIGMDTPQVTSALLDECLGATARPDTTATLGRDLDGGWWALGLRQGWDKDVFNGVEMSTEYTGDTQSGRSRGVVSACAVCRFSAMSITSTH